MEGPTPVSALIHAATMVTAGVYLLMRFSYVFEASSTSLLIVTWLGGLSALFGAAAGVVENDLKKVIAYSTTSQLGYMVVACGLSQYNLALFHLINHALFKALLFLSAGAVIYLIDQQDLRKMGSLV
jgi:NADH-ubiquinone oxidoreductase chain 5